MTHFVPVLFALVASFLLCSATPTSSSASHVTFFRAVERPEWQLDTSAASTADSSSSALSADAAAAASRADPSEPLSFLWVFPLRNLDWLEAEVHETHTWGSPRYLKRHSEEYVDAKVGPSAAEKDEVRVWLRGNGIDDSAIEDWRHNLKVDTTVGVVEALFNTTMHRYKHAVQGRTATVARSHIYVPAALAPRLSALDGVYKFPHSVYHMTAYHTRPRPASKSEAKRGDSASTPSAQRPQQLRSNASHVMHAMQTEETNRQCPSNYASGYYHLLSPASLASVYNFSLRATDTTAQSTRAAVAGGFAGQNTAKQTYYEAYSQTDLSHFQTNVGFSQSFSAVDYGGNNAANLVLNRQATGVGPTTEASLDIDALFQVSPTSTNGFYAVTGPNMGLYQSLSGVYALPSSSRPQTISYSYSFGYSDYDYNVDDNGSTETMLQLLANAGVTVIASAGDDGTPSSYNTGCDAASNVASTAAPSSYRNSVMLPQYPASSKYVLSVAETQFTGSVTDAYPYVSQGITSPPECNNCPTDQQVAFLCQSQLLSEAPVSVTNKLDGTTTGGGFSFVFPQPSWQQSAVSGYLSACSSSSSCTLPSSNQYASGNRAYPDVAAFGGYFSIVVNGKQSIVGGTSVSAPIWAGLIARLNEVALVRYGATLGLVAPTFYNMSVTEPYTFTDITSGNNICPRDNSGCVTAVNGGGSTSCQGFQSLAGWDPVTGLGSPIIGNMILFLNNEPAIQPTNGGGGGIYGSSGPIHFASTGRNGAGAAVNAAGWLLAALLLTAVAQLM